MGAELLEVAYKLRLTRDDRRSSEHDRNKRDLVHTVSIPSLDFFVASLWLGSHMEGQRSPSRRCYGVPYLEKNPHNIVENGTRMCMYMYVDCLCVITIYYHLSVEFLPQKNSLTVGSPSLGISQQPGPGECGLP